MHYNIILLRSEIGPIYLPKIESGLKYLSLTETTHYVVYISILASMAWGRTQDFKLRGLEYRQKKKKNQKQKFWYHYFLFSFSFWVDFILYDILLIIYNLY